MTMMRKRRSKATQPAAEADVPVPADPRMGAAIGQDGQTSESTEADPAGIAPALLVPAFAPTLPSLTTDRPLRETKQQTLIALLSRPEGCAVTEAATTLGWLPHTTRAAMTGLRRKGYRIIRAVDEAGGPSRHRIVPAEAVVIPSVEGALS
jgi:hypothetical protein